LKRLGNLGKGVVVSTNFGVGHQGVSKRVDEWGLRSIVCELLLKSIHSEMYRDKMVSAASHGKIQFDLSHKWLYIGEIGDMQKETIISTGKILLLVIAGMISVCLIGFGILVLAFPGQTQSYQINPTAAPLAIPSATPPPTATVVPTNTRAPISTATLSESDILLTSLSITLDSIQNKVS
jgi:hypothetical protein